ncbi:MAG: hypothetical protein Q8P25_03260, partial [Candidatus Curtissbacteria bacterium]|nr:hypothetical protein [Candidatus Curtissbacteria bacterium]
KSGDRINCAGGRVVGIPAQLTTMTVVFSATFTYWPGHYHTSSSIIENPPQLCFDFVLDFDRLATL